MKRRVPLALASIVVILGGGLAFATAAPGDLSLVCPVVQNPVAGQTITCTYVAEPAPTTVPPSTTTVPPTTTTTTPPVTTTTTVAPTITTTTQPPTGTLKGWQLTASNIGLAPFGLSCTTLPSYTGSLKPARGARIANVRITGPLDLSNGDIVVERSCIKPTSVGYHNSFLVTTTVCSGNSCSATSVGNVIVRDSEIDAEALSASIIARSCAFLGVATVQRNYMHGMGTGICFFETGTVHSALAEGNYVRGLRSAGDSHNEAATIRDFRNAPGRTVKFLNNRLDCSSGNETGGLFIQPTWLPIHNATVQGNYLEGGGYNLYLERTSNASYGNVRAIDNRFRPTGWGASATPSGPGWTEWRDNYRYDASKPDAKGLIVNP